MTRSLCHATLTFSSASPPVIIAPPRGVPRTVFRHHVRRQRHFLARRWSNGTVMPSVSRVGVTTWSHVGEGYPSSVKKEGGGWRACSAGGVGVLSHSREVIRAAWRDGIRRSGSRIAIDATAGRGSDTLALCELLGGDGTVHAFDIQQAALSETEWRYRQLHTSPAPTEGEEGHPPPLPPNTNLAKLQLHESCHSRLRAATGVSTGSVGIVTYNLGWYPGRGGDRGVVTGVETTVGSLREAEGLTAVGGVICVMAYVGHVGGREEDGAVAEWAGGLCGERWDVARLTYPNRRRAPTLVVAVRKGVRGQGEGDGVVL